MRIANYDTSRFYDEAFEAASTGAVGAKPRESAELLFEILEALPDGELIAIQHLAEQTLLEMGITFAVGDSDSSTERIFPFDVIPRIVTASDFDRIERGLKQRIYALNAFIDDVYHDQKIVKDRVVPSYVIESAKGFLPQCSGADPAKGIWCHVTGTDLIRDGSGEFFVLEDNLRCPSGVSYVLENRQLLKRTFPQVFARLGVAAVDDYASRLLEMLNYAAPQASSGGATVVLTPGPYNSAYFEHSYLARQMGCELVQGSDLAVRGGRVSMRTTKGFEPVDVIYRRINDEFLDPDVFNGSSLLGVKGLFGAWRSGTVTLANAPGCGVADDKVTYAYVPSIIKYFTGEDPIIDNIETFVCFDDNQRAHVLANLDKFVVKAANEAGGYGMLVGPHSTVAQRSEFAALIEADPRNYIAQPTIDLSRAPVIVEGKLQGRHVDLRPFVLQGEEIWVLPGGLTRVALRKGSLVVNSSQGGGSKDTWVVT